MATYMGNPFCKICGQKAETTALISCNRMTSEKKLSEYFGADIVSGKLMNKLGSVRTNKEEVGYTGENRRASGHRDPPPPGKTLF